MKKYLPTLPVLAIAAGLAACGPYQRVDHVYLDTASEESDFFPCEYVDTRESIGLVFPGGWTDSDGYTNIMIDKEAFDVNAVRITFDTPDGDVSCGTVLIPDNDHFRSISLYTGDMDPYSMNVSSPWNYSLVTCNPPISDEERSLDVHHNGSFQSDFEYSCGPDGSLDVYL